jgi:hypothetical protein
VLDLLPPTLLHGAASAATQAWVVVKEARVQWPSCLPSPHNVTAWTQSGTLADIIAAAHAAINGFLPSELVRLHRSAPMIFARVLAVPLLV